jgi:ketosteroid isomerase-like protein
MTDSVEIVKQVYAAFEQSDVAAVFSKFSPEIQWYAAESSPAYKGQAIYGAEAIGREVFQLIADEFPGMAIQIDELFGAGDKVVALGYYVGARKSTGKSFKTQMAHIWTIHEEKVAKFQQYLDTWKMHQAGLDAQ